LPPIRRNSLGGGQKGGKKLLSSGKRITKQESGEELSPALSSEGKACGGRRTVRRM